MLLLREWSIWFGLNPFVCKLFCLSVCLSVSLLAGGHLDVVRLLVEHKADVDSQDNRKVSCLMIAFRKVKICYIVCVM